MVEIKDIRDGKSLEAWLKGQPFEVSVAIAARAALRVLPLYWGWSLPKRDLTVLPILRCVLISWIASKTPTENIEHAATAAASKATGSIAAAARAAGVTASDATATTATAAATAAADAARAAGAAAVTAAANDTAAAASAAAVAVTSFEVADLDAVWEEVRSDCRSVTYVGDAGEMPNSPLWAHNPYFDPEWARVRSYLAKVNGRAKAPVSSDVVYFFDDWDFWVGWYQSILDGGPQDWALLEQVALLPDKVWQAGPEAVAEQIERLKSGGNPLPSEGENGGGGRRDRLVSEVGVLVDRELEQKSEALHQINRDISAAMDELKQVHVEVEALVGDLSGQQAELKKFQDTAQSSKAKVEGWSTDLQAQFDAKIEAAETALKAQHSLAAPTELWTTKETEHKEKMQWAYKQFLGGLIGTAVLVGCGLTAMFFMQKGFAEALKPALCDPVKAPAFCKGISVPGMITIVAILTVFTLLMWFIRLKMKEYLAERHLMVDAREKRSFSEAYVGLLAAGDAGGDAKDQRAIVYGALFRPSSDGIVKEDGGLDPSLAAGLSKLLSK